ncbi:MAG: NUDIX hydrolase [Longimicrobiales bacterium]
MAPPFLDFPHARLPAGYAGSLKDPPGSPVRPRPAATLALLREAPDGLEVLLLKRSDSTRFIPGAFVFPGGRVDENDASAAISTFLGGPSPSEADTRLGISGGRPPGLAYWAAALRETFEEAGILVERGAAGFRAVPLDQEENDGRLRKELHGGRATFPEVLKAMGATLDGKRLAYIGHWKTPVQERYRYDTRFFGAEIPADCPAFPDGVEMVEALWITPTDALTRNRAGGFPMVFPTLMTLQALEPFRSPRSALEHLAGRKIPCLLPRVEAREDGVRLSLEAVGPV